MTVERQESQSQPNLQESLSSAQQRAQRRGQAESFGPLLNPATLAPKASDVSSEAMTEPATEETRVLITKRRGTTVWISNHQRPWTLPLDALVIPVATGGGAGSLGEALLGDVERTHPDLLDFGPILGEPRLLTPEDPVPLERSDAWKAAGLPANLVLATAERRLRAKGAPSQRWSAKNAGAAAKAVVRLAQQRQWGRLAIPLLGSGAARLPAAEVAEEVLLGVQSALPAPAVREITILTLDNEVIAALAARASARSQTFANDLPTGDDLLDVETEVHALAEAIVLRELEPPLVVGVLGGWGSGKSFVMHLMRERISEVRALLLEDQRMAWGDDPRLLSPYVGHPYVITFDAWTYANADLWASLMQTVFRELSRQLTLEAQLQKNRVDPLTGGDVWKALTLLNDAEGMAMLAAALADEQRSLLRDLPQDVALTDVLWTRLQELKRAQLKKLEAAQQERREAADELAAAQRGLEADVAHRLDAELRREAWQPFRNIIGVALERALRRVVPVPAGEEPLGPEDAAQFQALADHVSFVSRMATAPPIERLAFLAIAAATLAAPFLHLVDAVKLPVVGAGVLAAVLQLRHLAARWDAWFADLRKQYAARREATQSSIPARRDAILAQLRKTSTVPELEDKLRQKQAEETACQEKIGTPAGFVSLAEFVQARLSESPYETKLGLMHQVQRDIAALSDCLVVYDKDLQREEKIKFFPRGPARVVLFIDDLDRCPPDQVVAVLEAVQLLVKTRLFVVVLGMDVRYVTRALEKRYEGILWRHGDPSGLDYIEKIVQVPYRVRPIDPQAYAAFLQAQMQVARVDASARGERPGEGDHVSTGLHVKEGPRRAQVRAELPLTRTVLEFSEEEFQIAKVCCEAVELGPRSVKRVVNVFKLLKIIWYRGARYSEPERDVKCVVVMLLALAARYPEAMRDLLDELSEAARRQEARPIGEWLQQQCRRHARERGAAPYWSELDAALMHHLQAMPSVSVSTLGLASSNLVRSFSFLGDIGVAEPESAFARTQALRDNGEGARRGKIQRPPVVADSRGRPVAGEPHAR